MLLDEIVAAEDEDALAALEEVLEWPVEVDDARRVHHIEAALAAFS